MYIASPKSAAHNNNSQECIFESLVAVLVGLQRHAGVHAGRERRAGVLVVGPRRVHDGRSVVSVYYVVLGPAETIRKQCSVSFQTISAQQNSVVACVKVVRSLFWFSSCA